MVRRLFLLLLAGACSLSASIVSAQTVDDIVARNIDAKGGLEKLRATTSIKATSRVRIQGTEASLTTYAKRPNLLRQEMRVGDQTQILAFDGTAAWAVAPLSGSKTAAAFNGSQADALRDQADFDGPLMDWRSKGRTIQLVGSESMGARPVYHLKVIDRTERVTHVYLDTKTGLEAKIVRDVEGGTLEQQFADYRQIGGLTVPFSIRVLMNGAPQSELIVRSVEFNLPAADGMFALPK